MPVVRRIRNRGATVTVEANAEILFMPGGQVHTWTNRFTGRIRAGTIAEAPTNSRPRWGHYGKPLKATIVSARPRFWGNGRDRQRVYAAVGATAPHAYYVDQGTGVYAGNGPYAAKVLPPWSRGDASLYEATWRPGGPGTRKVNPITIKGQKGQFFFDKGLKRAFQSMRMRGYQVAGDPKISGVLNAMPTGLDNFLGNTPADAAFRKSLEDWRRWRDDAFNAGDALNRSRYDAREVFRQKAQKAQKAKSLAKKAGTQKRKAVKKAAPKKPKKGWATVRDKQDAAVAAFRKQNPNVKIKGRIPAGLVVVAPRDNKPYILPWSRLYGLID